MASKPTESKRSGKTDSSQFLTTITAYSRQFLTSIHNKIG